MAQLDKLGLSCYTTWWSLKSFIFCLPQQWQKPAIMVFWGANRQKCVKLNFFFGSYLTLLLSWNKKRAPLFWRHGQKMLPYPLPLNLFSHWEAIKYLGLLSLRIKEVFFDEKWFAFSWSTCVLEITFTRLLNEKLLDQVWSKTHSQQNLS